MLPFILFVNCATHGIYKKNQADTFDETNSAEIRVSNFKITKINGQPTESVLQKTGTNIFVSKPSYDKHFKVPPGDYEFDLFYFHFQNRRHAGTITSTTTTSDTMKLKFTAKKNQVISICYLMLSETEAATKVKAEARLYNFPEDFKSEIFIPFSSNIDHLPGGCYGYSGQGSTIIGTSN